MRFRLARHLSGSFLGIAKLEPLRSTILSRPSQSAQTGECDFAWISSGPAVDFKFASSKLNGRAFRMEERTAVTIYRPNNPAYRGIILRPTTRFVSAAAIR